MEKLQSFSTAILGFIILSFLTFICVTSTDPQNNNYTFLQEATSAPLVSYHDYIVVGGGTAGCPLAATLSQNARVLLLERGGSPYGNTNITDVNEFGKALRDTSPSSPAQQFVSEDGVTNHRARVLGGGTCLNGGFYSRADIEFLKESGIILEDGGGAGEEERKGLEECYEWVEEKIVRKPNLKKWQAAVRDGLVEVGVIPDNNFTYEHVNGTKVGGVTYGGNGHRFTAADLLQFSNPFMINVLLHATAFKILFKTIHKGTPSEKIVAHGVVFRDALGIKHRAYLNRGTKNEIILSAGAIGSPQLLMLSGVGPANHLSSHKIKVVLDRPLVGQGMSDNTLNFVYVPSRIPVDVSLPQVVGITGHGNFIEAVSGVNLELPPQDQENILSHNENDFQGGYVGPKVIGPLSSGHMELRSRNPDDNPSVTFNYFDHPKDLERCVNGIRITGKVIESEPFSKFKYEEHSFSDILNISAHVRFNLRPKHENTSTSFEQYCKDNVMTIWHYHGGCQIGKVIDRENYKIMGLESIRVVDSSIFLSSPGTNPQATLMMLGRYMGVKILKERLNVERKSEGDWQNNDFLHNVM